MTSNAPDLKSASQAENDGAEAASTSWIEQPATVRRLQILVIFLGVVLIFGFAAVIGRIAYLALQPTPSTVAGSPSQAKPEATDRVTAGTEAAAPGNPQSPQTSTELIVPLPAGASLKQITPFDGNLLIQFEKDGMVGALLVDAETGRIKRRYRFQPATP
jgi:hypothetical protein